jgi:predicted TIM-barrel fold metal-dependent hydrolase
MDPPGIDCHAHIYTHDMPLAPTAWHRPEREAPLADFLAELKAHGIARAVLAAASLFGDNENLLAATEANPSLRTSVNVRPDIAGETLRQMDRRGAVGIRLQLMHHPLPDLAGPEYTALFRRVADLGWHVHIHDNAARIAYSLPILARTGVRLVIDHFGRPDPKERLASDGFQAVLRTIENGRTWVKLSSAFRLGDRALAQEAAAALLAAAGPERMMWGSDWPFAGFEGKVGYADTLRDLEEFVPDPDARRRIGHDTPAAFYFGRRV